jgi:hypothetical protein
MSRFGTASVRAASLILICLTACAPPPKEVDYSLPDAAPAPDAPIPIAVSPANGAEDVPRKPVVRVTFDRQLYAPSLRQSKLDFISGPLNKWSLSYYDPVKMELVAWTSGKLLRHTTWYFQIEHGVLGMNGAPVTPDVMTTFRTGDSSGDEAPFQVHSFEHEIGPLLSAHCATCHGDTDGLAGLRLDSKESIEETALETPAQGWQDWKRIVPTRPGESYLMYKVIGYEHIAGMPMPRALNGARTTLTLSEKTALTEWIAQGAIFFDPNQEDE